MNGILKFLYYTPVQNSVSARDVQGLATAARLPPAGEEAETQ